MPTIIPEGYAQASLVFGSSDGTPPFVTTIGVSRINYSNAELVDLANLVFARYREQFRENTTTSVTGIRCDLAVGLPGGTSGTITSDYPSWEGTSSGAYEPLSMAVIANKLSADFGRKGKGRSYLVGLLSDGAVASNGRIADTTRASYSLKWNNFITELAADDLGFAASPVILHADGSAPTIITGGSISERVGWVRKRLR